MNVVKAGGGIEPFSEEKVLRSIKRAGIPESLQLQALQHVKEKLHTDMETWEIYHHITEFLSKSPLPYSKSSYSLKQAIMLLGPTGYPFEDFVAKVLETKGYSTEVRQILRGNCVTHEIDVVAKNGKDEQSTVMVEAKFHNSPGARSDIHVSMYTKARFDDLKERYRFREPWLVTNTKATVDAVTYAQCVGMKVISWSYPDGESLRDMIEKYALYPITMLSTLQNNHKFRLLENHIVLCSELRDDPGHLDRLGITNDEKTQILSEVTYICKQTISSKPSVPA